jgi:nucleoporin GLE1
LFIFPPITDSPPPPLVKKIAALDVLGLEAKSVWGQQWDKMLHLIETGVTTGYEDNKLIGGDFAEGSAARTRVMLVLETL